MSSEISNTFCILPWVHVYANPNGDVLPCCIANKSLGNLHNNSIVEIWNNDEYKNLRTNMLNGIRSEHCKDCYLIEDRGIYSKRQKELKNFELILDVAKDNNPKLDIKFLDIRWSNICNYKCKTCSGDYSSKWAESERRDKIFMFAGGDDNDKLYNDLKPFLNNLQKINFAGGEPLLMDKHYEILEYLIEVGATDTNIIYNTNLSKLSFKGKRVTDLWNKFKYVSVFASIDGWGEKAAYIREGTVWSEIENNIRQIRKECPHVKLEMNTTVSVLNVYALTDLIDYITENKLFTGEPHFYNLINPNYYSIDIIKNKQSLLNKLKEKKYSPWIQSQLDKVISFVENSNHNHEALEEFKKRHPDFLFE
jgi:radical SAM protein with 4Fe4S-binding SPASM domain